MIYLIEAECRVCKNEQDFRIRLSPDWTDRELREMLDIAPACEECVYTDWDPLHVTDSTPQEALI